MKKISIISIITTIIYFISVLLFLITKTDFALTLWEVLTVIGGLVFLVLLVNLSEKLSCSSCYKRLVGIFMACAVTLTSAAHIVNITVTRRLISEGVNVPDYFRIGQWPSVEMCIDYLAWGGFVGLAFLFIGMSIKNKTNNPIKVSSITAGILCLVGFIGALCINENLWYIAPIGYGIIPIYICVKTMKIEK